MSWPKSAQLQAEIDWFWETADHVASECGGSLISGRRTRKRNSSLPGAHPKSLHMLNLAGDYEFDVLAGYQRAWVLGRSLGLHGYRKPGSLGIHWQARPKERKVS